MKPLTNPILARASLLMSLVFLPFCSFGFTEDTLLSHLQYSSWERVYDQCGAVDVSQDLSGLFDLASQTPPIRHNIISFLGSNFIFHSAPSQICQDESKSSHLQPDCRTGSNEGEIEWSVYNNDEAEFTLTANSEAKMPDVWGGPKAFTRVFRVEGLIDNILVLSTLDGTSRCYGQRWFIYLTPAHSS